MSLPDEECSTPVLQLVYACITLASRGVPGGRACVTLGGNPDSRLGENCD